MVDENAEEQQHWTDRIAMVYVVVVMVVILTGLAISAGIAWLLNRVLLRYDYEIIPPDLKGRFGYHIVRPKRDLAEKLRKDAEDSAQVARFREWLKKV